jgi:hypothetical protein
VGLLQKFEPRYLGMTATGVTSSEAVILW